ncbi:hypothetical protein FH972_021595 [Carpinus fangiana]|uniref:DASH complex subunit ASK1 n=1 Tax=Carpinus fangiana TaxID=176857 RepID=A0A5N6KQ54_9ROSI|nr:hypothetical protein FH972_021595 [Carpinus fangiana]
MSRMSMAPQRNLTLTEELERLEQSITLTLQGTVGALYSLQQKTDKNQQRLITTSVALIVSSPRASSPLSSSMPRTRIRCGKGQSANISLTSYAEADQDETFVTQTTETQDQHDGQDNEEETITTNEDHDPPTATPIADNSLEDSLLSSPSVRSSRTPKQAQKGRGQSNENTQKSVFPDHDQTSGRGREPTTPGAYEERQRNMAETPGRPSPFLHSAQPTTQRKQQAAQNDVLLHRVLDKNYRVQATPHSTRKTTGRPKGAAREDTTKTQQTRSFAFDSSPMSPEMAAPQLRSEIFGSPAKGSKLPKGGAPPTPGVSVQQGKGKTPRRGTAGLSSARKTLFSEEIAAAGAKEKAKTPTTSGREWEIDYDDETSDFDYDMGMSPPKTMQFHVPQSRLLQTPAKEASKRIVEELMMTAGAGDVTDTLSELQIDEGRYDEFEDGADYEAGMGDDSPSVVRVAKESIDDSF